MIEVWLFFVGLTVWVSRYSLSGAFTNQERIKMDETKPSGVNLVERACGIEKRIEIHAKGKRVKNGFMATTY